MSKEIAQAAHEIDAQQPVTRILTLEQIRSEWLASPRLTAMLISIFAGLALVITLAGISGRGLASAPHGSTGTYSLDLDL